MKGAALIQSESQLHVFQVCLCVMDYLNVVMDLTNSTAQVHYSNVQYIFFTNINLILCFMIIMQL